MQFQLRSDMKIVINGRLLNKLQTGIANYTKEIALNLAQLDNEVVLITNNPSIILPNVHIKTSPFQVFGPLFDFFVFGFYAKGNDIVFSPANSSPLFAIAGKKVSTIHDMSVYDRSQDYSLISRFVIKLSIFCAYTFSEIVITDSKYSKKRIHDFLGKRKEVNVIGLGVNRDEIESLIKNSKLKKEKIVITTNATHYKRKNILGLVEALKHSKYRSKIMLVTMGVKFDSIREDFVDQRGFVSRKDLFSLVSSSDLFVYPSFYEGFGLPVLEAMICRCPVIVSNATCLPEIVPDARLMFNPYNQKDIYDKIDFILTMPKNRLGELIERNYAYAKNFSWRQTAIKTKDIFEKILNA